MWKLHIRQIAVIMEIARFTQTKEIAEMGDMPDITKIIEMVQLETKVEIAEIVK